MHAPILPPRFLPVLLLLLLLLSHFAKAQLVCPTNVDLESGNTTNWNFYIGYATGASTLPSLSSSSPISGRHSITSGSGTDYYGGFPVVCPGAGSYSMKLGNSNIGAEVDQARYLVSVPANVNNYSLIYRYAVVFEDPQHSYYEQPYFRVRAYDQSTGAVINCSYYYYVSQSGLPGFQTSPNAYGVYYKNWTTSSLNLSGMAGKNVVIEFTAADCALGGHMGYGYVDMTCGLFAISNNNCAGTPTSPLTAPAGFKSYMWYNSNYSTLVDTTRTIAAPSTSTPTVYHVILTPYPGYGCTDTLTTSVVSSSLTVNAGADTSVCNSANVPLQASAAGNGAPYTYSWLPTTGLSCSTCTNPTANPASTTNYVLTVSDANGCMKSDTVKVKARPSVSTTSHFPACGNVGSVSATGSWGTPPYTYSWNTSPMQFTANAYSLLAGAYSVTVKDSKNCTATASVSLVQPQPFTASIGSATNAACNGTSMGSATVVTANAALPIAYSWNTAPSQRSPIATNLYAGTYIATVTDADGCTDTAIAVITQPAQLSATMTKADVSCFGGTTGTATVTASGGTTPYAYSWNTIPAQTSATAANLSTGARSVTVIDAKGCIITASVNIGQPAALAITATKTDVLCFNGNTGSVAAAVSGGTPPYSYVWNTLPAQTGTMAQALPAGSYTATVIDSKGCTASTSVIISQPAQLSGSITKTDVSCAGGANGAATVTPSGGKQPYSYAWNTSPAQTTPVVSNLVAGSYSIVIMDSNGCTKSSTITIAQPALLTASSSITNVSCYGGVNGTASVTASGGTMPYSYLWNTFPSQAAAIATGLPAGNYTATVSDAKGCTAIVSATIAQPTRLSLSTTKTAVSCYGLNNGTATAIAAGGTMPYSYGWSTAPAQTAATASGFGAGTFSVTVTDDKGCTASDSVSITQPAQLTGSFMPSRLACFGDKNGTAAATVSGGTPPYAYAWNTSPVQTSATATGLVAGTYSLSATDANGCTITLIDSVQQPSKVIATAAITHAQCYGAMGAIAMLPSGGTPPYAYVWNVSPNANTPNSGPLPAGAYTTTITDSAGCALTIAAVIAQPQKLTLTGSVVKQPCKWGAEGTLSVTVSGGTAPYAYLWNTVPRQTSPLASKLTTGSYRVVVTDSAGCTDTAQLPLQSLPISITAERDQSLCLGKSAMLHAAGGTSYRWWPNAGLSCLACTDPVASPAQTTQYFVVGTDANGCTDTARTLITVIQHQSVSIGPAQDICVGGVAGLSAQGGKSYLWLPADGLDNPASATPQTGPLMASRTYKVVIGNNSCFSDTLSQTVNVHPAPRIQLGPDFHGISGASIPLEAKSEDVSSIVWMPAGGLSCANCFTPTATLNGNITYVATVSNSWGCTASDTLNIAVGCDEAAFYMANTFTPNGDGQNDRFFPQGKGVSKVAHFAIYDRWGENVFSVSNMDVNTPDGGWDGTYKGLAVKPDVYLYVIEAKCADGSPVVVRGDVALIR